MAKKETQPKGPSLDELILGLEAPLEAALADESNGSAVLRSVWLNLLGSVSHWKDAVASEGSLDRDERRSDRPVVDEPAQRRSYIEAKGDR